MYKKHGVVRQLFIFIALIMLANACTRKNLVASTYRAINGKDTAELKLSIDGNLFHGTYKINYPGGIVDSGFVRGEVKGDTLIGHFRYRPHGYAHLKSEPIALLKADDGVLIQGRGHVAVYMNIPYFWEKTPIKYDDPEFVFKPIH